MTRLWGVRINASVWVLLLCPPRKRKLFVKILTISSRVEWGNKSFIQMMDDIIYLYSVSFSGVILMNAFARKGMQ
jgi:hypothetical protein